MQDVLTLTRTVTATHGDSTARSKSVLPQAVGRALLIGIVVLGAALRLWWVLAIPNQPVSNFAVYQHDATLIFHNQPAPDITFDGVGYPLSLGLVYRLVGSNDILVGKLFNLVLSLATLFLSYYVFRKLTANRAVAYSAMAVVAMLPEYIAYTGVLGGEVLFTFLLVAVLAVQLSDFDARIRYPLLGLLIGAGTTVRPILLVYPLVAAVTVWLVHKNWKKALTLLVVSTTCMCLVLAPVTYWNYQQFQMFIPNTYNAGINMFINDNSDNTVGGWMPLTDIHITPEFQAELRQHGMTYPDIPQDQRFAPVEPLFRAEAEMWIVGHPLRFTELGMLRVRNAFFSGAGDIRDWAMADITDTQINASPMLKIFLDGSSVIEVLLSLAGVIYLAVGLLLAARTAARRRKALPVGLVLPAIIFGFFMVVVYATEGQPRYGVPALFLEGFCMAMLVGVFVDVLLKGNREATILVDIAPVALPVPSSTRASATLQDREPFDTAAREPSGRSTTRGLSVVLPAHNEELVIEDTVRRCVAVLDVVAPDYEIIVVDDGSTDRTGEIADALSVENPRIRVVHNRPNRGYGGALIAGFQAASKELTFFMDSDGQFDIADIATLLRYREQGYRAVLGWRKHRQDAFMRLVNAWGWKMLVRLLLGLHVRDIDCAFKLYDTALVRTFDVQSSGAMINTEMLTKLVKLGIPFIEVPVQHLPRLHGKATGANVRVIARAFKELVALQAKLRTWSAPVLWEPATWVAERSMTAPPMAATSQKQAADRHAQQTKSSLVQRVLLYLLVGGIAAVVNLFIFHLVYAALPFGFSPADSLQQASRFGVAFVCGTEISIIVNFLLNDRLTFSHLAGHQRPWIIRGFRFHLTCFTGTALTFLISGALTLSGAAAALIGMLSQLVAGSAILSFGSATFAQAIAIAVVTAFNFSAHHLFTYRRAAGTGSRP